MTRDRNACTPLFGASVNKWHDLPRTPENLKSHAKAIFRALKMRQAAELSRAVAKEHRNRTDRQVGAAYAAIMQAKRTGVDSPEANRLVKDFPR